MAKIYTSSVGMYAFNAQVIELQSQSSRNRYVNWYLNGTYKGANTIGTGTTVSPTRTFSSLNAGTTYSIEAKIYWSDTDTYITSLYGSVTTNKPADTTAPTINNIWCSVSGWTNESYLTISANITDSSGIYSSSLLFNGSYYNPSISGNTYSWRVPTPTVFGYYDIEIAARDNSNNTGYASSRVRVGLDNIAPTINYSEAKFMGGGIRAGANASDTAGASGVDYIYFKISSKNSSTDFSNAIGVEGDSVYHTFTADKNGYTFELGATYYVEITAKDIAGNYSSKTLVKVVPTLERPANWNWNDYERNAFENRGAISTLTWQRWNAFLDNVKGTASWYHNNASDVYGVEKAKMSDNSKILTAERFNIVKNAIGSMNSTGISDRKKGDFVLGSYFITLSLKLSEIRK